MKRRHVYTRGSSFQSPVSSFTSHPLTFPDKLVTVTDLPILKRERERERWWLLSVRANGEAKTFTGSGDDILGPDMVNDSSATSKPCRLVKSSQLRNQVCFGGYSEQRCRFGRIRCRCGGRSQQPPTYDLHVGNITKSHISTNQITSRWRFLFCLFIVLYSLGCF